MHVEKLIEEIRKYPELYDQSNEKYRHSEYKERVWKQIATTLKAEGGVEECKRRWASIRDQLRRTLQKRKTKSGQSAVVRKYKYEDILKFLIPYFGELESATNVPEIIIKKEEDGDIELVADSQHIFMQEECHEEDISSKEEQQSPSRYKDIRTKKSYPPKANRPKKYKFATHTTLKSKLQHRDSEPQDSPANQLMAYILAEREAQRDKVNISPTHSQNPVDAFLCGISPTLKTLDPVLLNEAKGRIFSVVQELELRQLQLASGHQDRFLLTNFVKAPSPSPAQSPSS